MGFVVSNVDIGGEIVFFENVDLLFFYIVFNGLFKGLN